MLLYFGSANKLFNLTTGIYMFDPSIQWFSDGRKYINVIKQNLAIQVCLFGKTNIKDFLK